jgi:hypothetical protein
LEPLPTKEKPTFIRIGNTQKPLSIRIDRYALLRLESDAPDGYLAAHVHARLIMVCDPDGLVALDSKSDFRGGRARMTVRPTDRAKPGDTGTLSVYLITPEDKQIPAKISFRIDAPEEQPTTGSSGRAKVQVPKPIPVSKEEWATLGWDANDVAEVRQDNKDTEILVNMDNKHIAKLLHGANYQEMGIKRMRNNYLLYVAFYSWAQFTAMKSKDFQIDEAQYEEYLAGEFDRVAQTVVHSISALNRLEDEEQ